MPTALEQLAALIRGPEPKQPDEATAKELGEQLGITPTAAYRLLSQKVAAGEATVRQTIEHRGGKAFRVNVYRVRKPDEQAHPQD